MHAEESPHTLNPHRGGDDADADIPLLTRQGSR
jgi:hypothetical protein